MFVACQDVSDVRHVRFSPLWYRNPVVERFGVKMQNRQVKIRFLLIADVENRLDYAPNGIETRFNKNRTNNESAQ